MAIDKATTEEKKVCHSCGAAIPARDTYCMRCGARQQTEGSPRLANNWFSQAGSLDDSLNSGYTPPLQAAAGETPPTETVKSTFLKPVKDVSTRSPVPGRLATKPAEPRKQDPEPEETDINGSAATTFIKPVRTSKEPSSRRKYGSAPTVPIENFVDPIEGVKGPGFHGDNTTAAGVKKSSKGKMPVKPAKAFDWKRWIPVAAGAVVICLLVIVFSAGGSTNKTVERVSSEIASVENAFLDEDGYVALEHKDQLLSSVYQTADEMDEVDYCERNEYGVYMVLENGLGMHYQAPVSGLAAGGTELEVYAYQPFYDEFTAKDKPWYDIAGKMIGRCGEYPSEAIEALERLEITDNKANRFYNQDVTLEWLKKPHQNSVIVWVGHGGYSPETHSTLLLTVEYSDTLYKKYKDDFDNHRIEIVHSKPKNTICITPAFFAHHLKADALENSIVYLASCFSGKDDVLVSTLLSKGASAVYWNSGEILQHYNNKMCRSVMEALCDGASTGNALAIAQDANGALDNTLFGLIKKNVWVDCSGDQYLTLQEMYNRANRASAAETIPPTQPQQTWPTQRELFNGKCWMLAVGPTLGGQYVYKFYEDGTYTGYNVGSGQKVHGTYAYDHGVLELDGELYDLIEPDHFQSRNTYYNAQFDSEIHSDLHLGGDDMWNNMVSQSTTQQTQSKPYVGTWLYEFSVPFEDNYRIVITDDSILLTNLMGQLLGPFSYTEVHDGQYTKLTFVDDLGEQGVVVYINPDMIGCYFEENAQNDANGTPSFGSTGSGSILFRAGAETTNIDLPDDYYQWFSDDEYEYMYYPNANVLYVWNGGNEYLLMYIHEDGTLEYMEAISLLNAKNLPGDAIYTRSNFVITDNR